MSTRLFVALVTAFILFPILGFHRAEGQINPAPRLVEGAKKEGEMIFYTTMTLDQSKEVVDRFQKKYPFIKPTLFRTGGGPLLNKIFTEARGGRHAWDVVVGRAEMVVPLMQRKLIASYRSPETKMLDDDLVDQEGYWSAYYVISYVLGWHTKLVKREEVPKTYEALVDPKWKGGQLSFDNEAYGMLQGLMRAWGREKAIAYFKRIAAIEPSMKRGNTERVALAAAGEYPLTISYNQTFERMVARGAPMDWLPLEPAVVSAFPIMIAAKAPHPNAARLYYDFSLSKEGQEMLTGMQRIPVRKDVEPNPPRLFRGYKRVVENPEDYTDFEGLVKLYNDIFKLR
jgi:iron(III) transport system substrate-binding protein